VARSSLTSDTSRSAEADDRGDCEPAVSVRLTRQELGSVSGDDFVHSAYYGTILVGSPALEMTVVFDTGSGNLVLPSSYCRSPACQAHRRYRRSSSHSGRDIDSDGANVAPGSPRDSLTIAYGTGEASGVFVEDRICLDNLVANDSAGSACLTFHFIAASDLSEDPFMSFNFDGILGLGLSPLAQTKKFSFMEVMAESLRARGSRAPLTFGIFLASSRLEDSEIALGGWEKTHLREDLSWNQLYNPELGHWIVPIRGIRVDSERLDICDDGQCRAAVDTGTSLLAVPTFAFREMYEWLRHSPGAAGHCQGFGRLLHFELEAFTVTLGPRDYAEVKGVSAARQRSPRLFEGKAPRERRDIACQAMMMTLDLEEPLGPKLFILGEPVLRKYYTVFDGQRKEVGIGRARHVRRPSREELLERAVEVEPVARQRLPTMFDVFRWRKLLQ